MENKTFIEKHYILLPSIIILLSLIIYFVLPIIITKTTLTGIEYSTTGQIGDTIGGITGPIIAIIAAFITYMAFWVQFKANQQQKSQFLKQSFESKFFEMIKMHNEIVSNISIMRYASTDDISSKKVFIFLFKEYYYCYCVIKNHNNHMRKNQQSYLEENDLVNISFILFFFGIGETSDLQTIDLLSKYDQNNITNYISLLEQIQKRYQQTKLLMFKTDSVSIHEAFPYFPFDGHSHRLGHYYRNLFQIVKYVHSSELHSFDEKYSYLKILRSQLSSYEQLLLFYNSLTTMGQNWSSEKYLLNYKLIKNIPLPLANFGVNPKDIYPEKDSKGNFFFEWDEIKAN